MNAISAPSPQILPEGNWYAVHTRYHCEKTVTTHLENKGFSAFLPALKQVHRWSDRQKPIEIPLFAGYTFVCARLSPAARLLVLRTPGVVNFVSFGGDPISIPRQQIESLQSLLANHIPCSLSPFLTVGKKVRIRGGCLDGLEGILMESAEKALIISIECIQRSVAVRIEGYELELI